MGMQLYSAMYRLTLALWVARNEVGRKEFSRLHGISMVVNLVVLLEGTALIVGGEWFRR